MTSSNGNIFRVTGPLCGEFTGHRWIPLTKASERSFDVFFDLHLNKRLSKQSWGWWFETPWCPLWRHCNVLSAPCSLLRCFKSGNSDIRRPGYIIRMVADVLAPNKRQAISNHQIFHHIWKNVVSVLASNGIVPHVTILSISISSLFSA